MIKVQEKTSNVEKIKHILNNYNIEPTGINPFFESIGSATISEKQRAAKILLRPNVDLKSMMQYDAGLRDALSWCNIDSLEQSEIQIKYERYIEKENEIATKMSALEDLIIPDTFNYDSVTAISNEALQKFKKIKPRTLGQASRISGVNPSDVQILMVYMGR
jgi:tRNA uridine 5-carboxymethylaminomethyl modification enzyme